MGDDHSAKLAYADCHGPPAPLTRSAAGRQRAQANDGTDCSPAASLRLTGWSTLTTPILRTVNRMVTHPFFGRVGYQPLVSGRGVGSLAWRPLAEGKGGILATLLLTAIGVQIG